jgi:hypothetical protein
MLKVPKSQITRTTLNIFYPYHSPNNTLRLTCAGSKTPCELVSNVDLLPCNFLFSSSCIADVARIAGGTWGKGIFAAFGFCIEAIDNPVDVATAAVDNIAAPPAAAEPPSQLPTVAAKGIKDIILPPS